METKTTSEAAHDDSLYRAPFTPEDIAGLPATVTRAGTKAVRRFAEFFTANIRNHNTRMAYSQAVRQFFRWCDRRGLDLQKIQPIHVSAYIEHLQRTRSRPTVKQHLAAIRMLFDYMVIGQVMSFNPAISVRGPAYVAKRGKTPVLSSNEARTLLNSIATSTILGLRDRAIIALMCYSFARVSAAVAMRVEDYYPQGKRWWVRLNEKGGKRHEIPAHHRAEEYMDAYLEAASIASDRKGPLFRSVDKTRRRLTRNSLTRVDVLRMIKRRAVTIGLPSSICCHTFRATGITTYLQNGGSLEKAQAIAAHESPKTTKLYDRTQDELTLDEIERIAI